MRASTVTTAIAAIALTVAAAACGAPDDAVADAASGPAATISRPTVSTVAEPPGEPFDELVTVSGGRMHVRCSGSGKTTVLLMAGWDNGAETWSAVEPAIAQRARVCAYDRFGTGTSDDPATTQTFETQAADLHELLDEVGEPGPYVLIGHSFGGAEAVTFASMYADEVAGVMLVDASPTTWPDAVCSVPVHAGGCALMRDPDRGGERLDVFPAFEAVASITSLGDVPMTVLTAEHRSADGLTPDEHARLETVWTEGTRRWAGLSTTSEIVTVEDSGHDIQRDQPAVVIDEVSDLLRR